MRAAIYARFSSDLQSVTSIEDQIRICREYIEKEQGKVVQTYTDHAISGSSLRNREGILSLLDDAKSRRFELVIAEALDRISRDQEDIAAIYKRLKHAEIRLVTLAEGEINELHIGFKGTMNALFLTDLALKIRRGQRGRVEAGKIPGGICYGYRILRRLLEDGSAARGEREIHIDEAAIVQRIFNEYAAGLVPRKIAAQLNREKVPSPRGGEWNASTISGNRQRRLGILNNDLYIGRILYNRQRFIKDPDTGKRIGRVNPQHEWITKEVPELRIIEDDLWEQVQLIKKRYSSRWGNRRQSKKRLLTGLLKCGRCGGGMTIMRRDSYYCSARREKGTCDANRGITVSELEERVLKGLEEILLGNEELIDEFASEFQREMVRLRKERHGAVRGAMKELQQVERGIKRCLDFITGGEGDPGSVRDELRRLEARKRDIDADLKCQHGEFEIEMPPNLLDLYRRKVAELQLALNDETTRPRAVEIIRSLFDRIEVHPAEARGRCEVIIVGALAQILAFSQQKRPTIPSGDHGTFLMVAGVGFEPTTFRL